MVIGSIQVNTHNLNNVGHLTGSRHSRNKKSDLFYHCTVHFDIYKVHSPTNAHFIKLDRVSKFTLKITSAFSYMFQSTTIMREPSLEPS